MLRLKFTHLVKGVPEKYNDRWHPGSLRHKDININVIEQVELMVLCLPWDEIANTYLGNLSNEKQ